MLSHVLSTSLIYNAIEYQCDKTHIKHEEYNSKRTWKLNNLSNLKTAN